MSTSGLSNSGVSRFELNPIKASIAILKDDVSSLEVSATDFNSYKTSNNSNISNINTHLGILDTGFQSHDDQIQYLQTVTDMIGQDVTVNASPSFVDIHLPHASSLDGTINTLNTTVSSLGGTVSALASRSTVGGNSNITVTTSSGTTTVTMATALSIASAVLSGNLQASKVGIGTAPTNDFHIAKNVNGEVGMYIRNTNSGYYTIFRLGNDLGNYDFVMFKNGSVRLDDGGPNCMTMRNDNGNLIVSAKNTDGSQKPAITLNTVDGRIYGNNPISTPKVLTNSLATNINTVETVVINNQTDSVLYNHMCIGTSAPDRSGALKMISGVLNYHNGTTWVPIVTSPPPGTIVYGGTVSILKYGPTYDIEIDSWDNAAHGMSLTTLGVTSDFTLNNSSTSIYLNLHQLNTTFIPQITIMPERTYLQTLPRLAARWPRNPLNPAEFNHLEIRFLTPSAPVSDYPLGSMLANPDAGGGVEGSLSFFLTLTKVR